MQYSNQFLRSTLNCRWLFLMKNSLHPSAFT